MSTPLTTRVIIADDHPLIRTGIRKVLDAAPDLKVVGEASDGIEATDLALREDVDLAILDVAMPRMTARTAGGERNGSPRIAARHASTSSRSATVFKT